MRTATLAALLALAPGCAAQTPLRCDGMGGFSCEGRGAVPLSEAQGACAGTVGCRSGDMRAICTLPTGPFAVDFLVCTNGMVSDGGRVP